MELEFTKLSTFAAAELDTERNITGTIMNNVISAEECYVVRNDLEDITNEFLIETREELHDIDDAKEVELREKGITPNYLTQGMWELCFVKVGYEHQKQLFKKY
jgi:hypothetical protein